MLVFLGLNSPKNLVSHLGDLEPLRSKTEQPQSDKFLNILIYLICEVFGSTCYVHFCLFLHWLCCYYFLESLFLPLPYQTISMFEGSIQVQLSPLIVKRTKPSDKKGSAPDLGSMGSNTASCMTWGRLLNTLGFSFTMCKTEILSRNSVKVKWISAHKVLWTVHGTK